MCRHQRHVSRCRCYRLRGVAARRLYVRQRDDALLDPSVGTRRRDEFEPVALRERCGLQSKTCTGGRPAERQRCEEPGGIQSRPVVDNLVGHGPAALRVDADPDPDVPRPGANRVADQLADGVSG